MLQHESPFHQAERHQLSILSSQKARTFHFDKPKGTKVAWPCRGFPVEQYKQDRLGLVLAFWALGLHLGRPLISQTDYKADGTVFGSVLNHVTDGRFVKGQESQCLIRVFGFCACFSPMSVVMHHHTVPLSGQCWCTLQMTNM